MPSSKPEQRFRDIIKNIDRIRAFTGGLTYEQFVGDERTRLAVERCLPIISEAAVKLGELAQEACPTVPWPQIRRSGSVLRHDYDEIDHAIVWGVVTERLDELRRACTEELGRRGADPGAGGAGSGGGASPPASSG